MSTSPFGGMAGRCILPRLLACLHAHLLNEREFREEISCWWWPLQGSGSGGASGVGLSTAMAGRIPFEKVIHLLLLAFLITPPFLLLTRLRIQMILSPSSPSLSTRENIKFKALEENTRIIDEQDDEMMGKPIALSSEREEKGGGSQWETPFKLDKVFIFASQNLKKLINNADEEHTLNPLIQKQSSNDTELIIDSVAENAISRPIISCDFSQRWTDTCVLQGDVRIQPSSSSVVLVKSPPDGLTENTTYSLRPYARKWETPVMELIRPLSMSVSAAHAAQECGVRHAVPVVVLSTGGFAGRNFFHDFSDVLIPLFITSFHYCGRVRFLITNFNKRWVNKYLMILNRMSRYEVVNLDSDERVHCSGKAHVGLMSHSELVIDPARTPGNYSMADFRELLRSSLSLKRRSIGEGKNYSKPRLLLMLRKGSRELTNKREVVALTRRLGFKVVAMGPEHTENLSRFASVVNSCDVMVGVHGAGLTNMIFLPAKATLVQIIPWGTLRHAYKHDYGESAAAMGVKYLEYKVRKEESSLVKQYPREHPVFKDPESMHRQGWDTLWAVILDRQNITLDVRRFKGALQEAMRSLPPRRIDWKVRFEFL